MVLGSASTALDDNSIMASASASSSGSKKDKSRVATCQYCDMTFKKLEHAQRHERTHTLDRPYVCDNCGKTFARQDTLHRHSRLHSRADDDAPTAKAGRKRRTSIAAGGSGSSAKVSSSGAKASSAKDASGSSPSASSHSSTGSGLPPAIPISTRSGDLLVEPTSPDALGLSLSLPVQAAAAANHALAGAPPSFPAYSRPTEVSHSRQQHQQQQFPHFPSINPAVIPLSRRYSDSGHGATLASQLALGAAPSSASAFPGTGTNGSHFASGLPTSFVTSFTVGGATGGGGSQAGKRERPSLRPRALTLAGLPESLGCFSLVNSPEPSDAGSNSSAEEEDDERDEDDSMDLGDAVSRLIGSTASNSTRTTASLGEPSAPPESHYPSPTFTCDSPSGLNLDPVADLRAILDNDPVPSSVFQHTLSPPPTAQPEFDFESFAASIEGPIRHSPTTSLEAVPNKGAGLANGIPSSLDELLSSTAHNLEGPPVLGDAAKVQFGDQSGADRYPTPPSGSLGGPDTLHSDPSHDTSHLFEPSASYHLADHIEKAISHIDDPHGRNVLGQYAADAADHAATAAMFASGFGVSAAHTPSSVAPTSAAQLSALGLSFGLPALGGGGGSQQHRSRTSRHNSFSGYPSAHPHASAVRPQAPLLLPTPTVPLGSGSPYSAQQASFAAALSATYTTAYPTLTLPIAGFDLPMLSSFKQDTPPSLFIPSSNQQRDQQASQQQQHTLEKTIVGSAPSSSTSHFDRLARAWEERQRAAGYGIGADAGSYSAAPYANLKANAMSTNGGSNAKSTPAFYIPSSTGRSGSRDRSP
ncbi:hypothetical protein JCM10908_006092 [Rhodotorula pacifica]|uniref:C2H2-type zinc finger protein n=1 Tax=Rhodotorula pacifica TaxID=1495444 RepID=UPI00317ED803